MRNAALSRTTRNEIQVKNINADILAGMVAPQTVRKYQEHFGRYLTFAGSLDNALQASTLAQWRNFLAMEEEYSPHYINSQIAAVKRIIREAAQQGYVSFETAAQFDDVAGVKVKTLKTRLKANARTRITPAQMRQLVDEPDPDDIVGARDRALLLTLASSGCRVGEVVSMRRADIVPKDSSFVVSVLGKNKVKPEEAPISREAVTAIDAWLDQREVESDYIFTSFDSIKRNQSDRPMSPVSAWRIVQKYASRTGLDHVKPHDFRRFVGTQLAKDDIRQAQKALRHERIETTARHYVLDDLTAGLTENLF